MAFLMLSALAAATVATSKEFHSKLSRQECAKDHLMLQLNKKAQQLAKQNKGELQTHLGNLEMPWTSGCVIGGGFGFKHGCAYAPAVQAVPRCDAVDDNTDACLSDAKNDKVQSYTQDIRSSSDFSELLDTTTTAEGGGFGITVSTSVRVLTSSEITTSSVAFILGAAGEVKTTTVKNPVALRLTDGAKELLETSPDGFLERHSPYYVYSVIYGGSFMGSVTLNSKSTATRSMLDFAFGFSVNLGFFNIGASHKFLRDVQKRQEEVEMDMKADWVGGTGVHNSANATPEAIAQTYQQWSDTWRSNPAGLKIVLRRWVDLEEVQQIINNHDFNTQMLFHGDTVSPTIKKMLSTESGLMHLLQTSVGRAMEWRELQQNRTTEDEFRAFQFRVQHHTLALERLDELEVMRRQGEVLWGNTSWFIAKALIREFEDMKLAIGRQCDDGSRVVDGLCEPWEGSCPNGKLKPVHNRTDDDQCGACNSGYVLDNHRCRAFTLSDTHSSDQWDDHDDLKVLTNKIEGYMCAIQRVEVEDLTHSRRRPASAMCKVAPQYGRWRMHTEANGSRADASCGSRCIETDYPVSNAYAVSRNLEREVGASGVTRTSMVKKGGSICWLTTVSFFQASEPNEWAECLIKPSEDNRWEVQAAVIAKESRVGAQCGATCLYDLPEATFTVGDEIVKQWSYDDCGEKYLGRADKQHCFLTSMALSHARDGKQRPTCNLDTKENDGIMVWRLKVCNGWAHHTQTMCGARCVSFVDSVIKEAEAKEPSMVDELCGIGYRYSHEGYWSSAFDLKLPYGKVISSSGTDVSECKTRCNSISGCKGFSLWGNQDCWVYNELGGVKALESSTACVKK